jgi:hypothetical protein
MTRYFFDVTEPTTVRYDYSGRNLSSLDQARELAELIAMDIGCREGEQIPGTVVQVRDAVGQHLLAVAVQPLTAIAA